MSNVHRPSGVPDASDDLLRRFWRVFYAFLALAAVSLLTRPVVRYGLSTAWKAGANDYLACLSQWRRSPLTIDDVAASIAILPLTSVHWFVHKAAAIATAKMAAGTAVAGIERACAARSTSGAALAVGDSNRISSSRRVSK